MVAKQTRSSKRPRARPLARTGSSAKRVSVGKASRSVRASQAGRLVALGSLVFLGALVAIGACAVALIAAGPPPKRSGRKSWRLSDLSDATRAELLAHVPDSWQTAVREKAVPEAIKLMSRL
jgi:hypothetical protein